MKKVRIPDLPRKPGKIDIIDRARAVEITRKRFGIDENQELRTSLIYNSFYDSFAWLVQTSLKETVDGTFEVMPVLEIIADQPDKTTIQKWLVPGP
ncbi:MAG TPA: hypothetical protein VIV61_03085 [Candidatus Ozemobacteraceae bacterium]